MGVLNVTPDSFSDGGDFLDAERAIAHGRELAAEGADILDVGGESTRPGRRGRGCRRGARAGRPGARGAARDEHTVSIDTSKLEVARAALDAGAEIVNDVTALRAEPELAGLCADSGLHRRPDAHARRPAHDAGRPPLRRRGRRRQGVPRRADRGRRRGGDRRGADLGRPGHRVRQDRRAQPRADPAARRAGRARPPDRLRQLAQELHRQADGRRGRRASGRDDRLERAGRGERRRGPAGPRRRRRCATRSRPPNAIYRPQQ